MPNALTDTMAARFADLALGHVTRVYPNKMDHVLNGPGDLVEPTAAHPIFYGSFDWHSCVHGYWLLATIYRVYRTVPNADRIRDLMDRHLTEANVAGELAYLAQPLRGTFERPYGWAWMLMLAAELRRHETAEGRRWSAALGPLAGEFARRFKEFLPRATYPIRTGTHFNTAFALALASEYARAVDDAELLALLTAKAAAWYGGDAGCQAWEPGGDDFLSPALIEAECMRRLMSPPSFEQWLSAFLSRLEAREPATLFQPVTVSDRSDGKIAHLDGLNLSRAWCWRALAGAFHPTDSRASVARETAEHHLSASLPHVAGDYVGEHWLATYAWLALSA